MSGTPETPGLDGGVRNKSGQIEDEHASTKIKHLRRRYGRGFAAGWDGEITLGELLRETQCDSLTQYVRNHGHHPE